MRGVGRKRKAGELATETAGKSPESRLSILGLGKWANPDSIMLYLTFATIVGHGPSRHGFRAIARSTKRDDAAGSEVDDDGA